jgi:hypothetical protein
MDAWLRSQVDDLCIELGRAFLKNIAQEPSEYRARTLFYGLADKAELRLTYPDLEARRGPPKVFAWTPTYRALKEYFSG